MEVNGQIIAFLLKAIAVVVVVGCVYLYLGNSEIARDSYDHIATLVERTPSIEPDVAKAAEDGKISTFEYEEIIELSNQAQIKQHVENWND